MFLAARSRMKPGSVTQMRSSVGDTFATVHPSVLTSTQKVVLSRGERESCYHII